MSAQPESAVPVQNVPAEGPAAPERVPVRRALISVYDKTGLVELATALTGAGAEIISTGSTAAAIAGAGLPVTPVEDVTGFPSALKAGSRPCTRPSMPGSSPTAARPST